MLKESVLEVFAEEIRDNHTLWGLHIQGNEGKLDSLGFINPDKESGAKYELEGKISVYHNRDGKTVMIKDKNPRAARARGYLNCWICEGWQE